MLTDDGRPVCCELHQGDHADGRALLPVVDRLRARLGIRQVCWVADRGMISAATLREQERRDLQYIPWARMRRQREETLRVMGEERARAGPA